MIKTAKQLRREFVLRMAFVILMMGVYMLCDFGLKNLPDTLPILLHSVINLIYGILVAPFLMVLTFLGAFVGFEKVKIKYGADEE